MAVSRPETQYAKSGDVHIAHQILGEGPVDLLYAGGWVSNIEYAWENPDYARLLNRLGQTFRLIWFDKRRMNGIYRHCAKKHLHRYAAEFEFRYNQRSALNVDDKMRAETAMRSIVGKRLTYQRANFHT